MMCYRIFIISLFFLLDSCNYIIFEKSIGNFKAQKGILDLRNWDFAKNGPIKLDGEWEFYWEKLYSLEEINSIFLNKTYLQLPNTWNNTVIDGKPLSGNGFATYRLKILLPENSPALAIRSQQQATAFKIFVNGSETLGSGEVGDRKSVV